MTRQDQDIIQSHPELVELRAKLTELEVRKDDLAKGRHASAEARLLYDAALTRWARAYNQYEDALRSVVLP